MNKTINNFPSKEETLRLHYGRLVSEHTAMCQGPTSGRQKKKKKKTKWSFTHQEIIEHTEIEQ